MVAGAKRDGRKQGRKGREMGRIGAVAGGKNGCDPPAVCTVRSLPAGVRWMRSERGRKAAQRNAMREGDGKNLENPISALRLDAHFEVVLRSLRRLRATRLIAN